ncbi:MAG: hypothetical protein V4598_09920 [Bdellovibrionota bacterium]
MQNKFVFFFLLVLMSCGKDVKFTNELETSNAVTQAEPIAITQTANIIRNSANPPGNIIMNGRTYKISPFSSYVALNFISQQPEGVSIPVKIRGEVKSTEVYIKIIEQ